MKYTGGPMSEAMYYVLLTLMNPSHGYELMHEIKEVSDGRIEMGPGTLYGILSRMKEQGLITLKKNNGRRKTYEITKEGKIALRAEYSRLLALIEDGEILKEEIKNEEK